MFSKLKKKNRWNYEHVGETKTRKNGIGMKKKVLRNTYTIIAISNSYIHHDSVLFILVYNVKTKNMG